MVLKEENQHEDFVEALHHILECINKKGVENCSYDTQVAYSRVLDLVERLNHDTVLYRP